MEIIKQVSERTGISEQQAAQAVAGISDQLRGNLPGGLGDALGGLLGGGAPAGGAQSVGLDDLLGGLLGGAQQGAGGQQGVGLDDLLGGLMGGSQQGPQGGNQPGLDAGDLVGALGGILSGGQQGAAGQQGGFGLDDIIGMISGGGAQGNLNQGNVIQDISERAGISPEIAAAILPIVLEFLRDKLPPQLSDALGGILGTPNTNTRQGGDDGFGLDDIVGGLLGGNR
jgi:hypothetical protein